MTKETDIQYIPQEKGHPQDLHETERPTAQVLSQLNYAGALSQEPT